MNRKLTWSLLAGLMIFLPSCCDSDDEASVASIDATLIPGEWCSMSAYGDAVVLDMAYNHSYKGYSYSVENGLTNEEVLSGAWMFYSSNATIVLSVLNSQLQNSTTSYSVKELNENKMVLLNKELGSTETYYPLASTENLSVGDVLGSSEESISYVSNDNVINVDVETGRAEVVGAGTTFVMIERNGNNYVKKIIVNQFMDQFLGHIMGNIDDVLEIYGTPDVTGTVGEVSAVLYRENIQAGINSIQFNYDETTRQITKIILKYGDSDFYESQGDYIKSILYYDSSTGLYHNRIDMLSSEYIVSIFESNGALYMNVLNEQYLLTHGYS